MDELFYCKKCRDYWDFDADKYNIVCPTCKKKATGDGDKAAKIADEITRELDENDRKKVP